MKHFSLFLRAACLSTLLATHASAATNLVTNGGFEQGLSGWTLSGNTGFMSVTSDPVHSGGLAGQFGPLGTLGFLSQTLSTTIGQSYELSYWLNNQGSGPNQFQVSWGGNVIPSVGLTNSAPFGYTLFTVPNLVATSTSTQLSFGFRHDPAFWNLDDVSVTQSNGGLPGVPDGGSTLALLGAAVSLVALLRRKTG